MSDGVGEDEVGGAPLPAKRPTVIRPAPRAPAAANKEEPPAKAVPARPAPLSPGSRPLSTVGRPPPPIQPMNKEIPARPASVHGSVNGAGSKSKGGQPSKKKLEITIVDARPMSEMGFRGVTPSPTAPPSSQPPLSSQPAPTSSPPEKEQPVGGRPPRPGAPPPHTAQSPPAVPSRPSASQPLISFDDDPPPPATAADKQESSDLPGPPKPKRPTILRPASIRQKETVEAPSTENSSAVESIPTSLAQPAKAPPPRPSRPSAARSSPAQPPTGGVSSSGVPGQASEDAGDHVTPTAGPPKPNRPTIIRPQSRVLPAASESGPNVPAVLPTTTSPPPPLPATPPHVPPTPSRPSQPPLPTSPPSAAPTPSARISPVPKPRPRMTATPTADQSEQPDASSNTKVSPLPSPRASPATVQEPRSRPVPTSTPSGEEDSSQPPPKPRPPRPASAATAPPRPKRPIASPAGGGARSKPDFAAVSTGDAEFGNVYSSIEEHESGQQDIKMLHKPADINTNLQTDIRAAVTPTHIEQQQSNKDKTKFSDKGPVYAQINKTATLSRNESSSEQKGTKNASSSDNTQHSPGTSRLSAASDDSDSPHKTSDSSSNPSTPRDGETTKSSPPVVLPKPKPKPKPLPKPKPGAVPTSPAGPGDRSSLAGRISAFEPTSQLSSQSESTQGVDETKPEVTLRPKPVHSPPSPTKSTESKPDAGQEDQDEVEIRPKHISGAFLARFEQSSQAEPQAKGPPVPKKRPVTVIGGPRQNPMPSTAQVKSDDTNVSEPAATSADHQPQVSGQSQPSVRPKRPITMIGAPSRTKADAGTKATEQTEVTDDSGNETGVTPSSSDSPGSEDHHVQHTSPPPKPPPPAAHPSPHTPPPQTAPQHMEPEPHPQEEPSLSDSPATTPADKMMTDSDDHKSVSVEAAPEKPTRGGAPPPRPATSAPPPRPTTSAPPPRPSNTPTPSRPSGSAPPPPRPTPPAVSTHGAESKPVETPPDKPRPPRTQPARPARGQAKNAAAPPTIPPRPGPGHPLYHYMSKYPHGLALHDYTATQPDELSFKEGDIVLLVKRSDEQWLEGKVGDDQGLFPEAFIEVKVPLGGEKSAAAAAASWDRTDEARPSHVDKFSGPRCSARFDFEGEGEGELTLQDGDVIQLLDRVGTEWLRGEVKGRQGIFPSSFVEIIEDLPPDGTSVEDVTSNRVSALFDFEGQDGELSFQAGDDIMLLSQVNEEWLYGQCHGQEGQFPATFVSHVPPNLPAHQTSKESGLTNKQPNKDTGLSDKQPNQDTFLPDKQANKTESKDSAVVATAKKSGKSIEEIELEKKMEEGPGEFMVSRETVLAHVRAMYDYLNPPLGDLEFHEGDRIAILEFSGEDWAKGRLKGREGMLPLKFVAEEENSPPPSPEPEPEPEKVFGRVLHDFAGETDDDLVIKEGDVIEVQDFADIQHNWRWGVLDGKRGMFPAVFVEML